MVIFKFIKSFFILLRGNKILRSLQYIATFLTRRIGGTQNKTENH